ncbi:MULTISPECIES: hypothetical protein [Streptomyces]|uniref:Uncharacterized protein n=1 Tax=Streptomyces ardesiacus TaxID=285564 RepID=A0ABW8HGQ8_9ACTN|nr:MULTISPECIES: hypothetical protein [Streptomyces]MCL7368470.1 hypothetical protein [Streptomyces ardesiacus]NEB64938.1 hypothetical protein [Streptomyces diastaticus]
MAAAVQVQPRRVFNYDQLSAAVGGAGAGISTAAIGNHLDPQSFWRDAFLYAAPVLAIVVSVLVNWGCAAAERREIAQGIKRAMATVQEEIEDPTTTLARKEELRSMLRALRDEKIAHRI